MDKRTQLQWLALIATFFALGVIALGAFTRLIDAGLGCPDWPGCYGHLSVPLDDTLKNVINLHYPSTPLVSYKAWAEMIHRYFVGGLSSLIFFILIYIMTQSALRTKMNIFLISSLMVLLFYQIILGMWTVTLKLLPIVVTQHLLGGFLILSCLWLLYLNNKENLITQQNSLTKIPSFLLPVAMAGFILVIGQILLGAWTSTNYASLSCPNFPFCVNDEFFSWHFKEAFNLFSPIGINYEGGVLSDTIRQTIQMVHRIGAFLITFYLFSLAIVSIRKLQSYPELLQVIYFILTLLTVQLCLGIANVVFKLPLMTSLAHTLVAALLLLAVMTFSFKLYSARQVLQR